MVLGVVSNGSSAVKQTLQKLSYKRDGKVQGLCLKIDQRLFIRFVPDFRIKIKRVQFVSLHYGIMEHWSNKLWLK